MPVKLLSVFLRTLFVATALYFWCFSGEAQSLKQFTRKANKQFEKKNYFRAIAYYDIALTMDSSNMDINFRYAEANRFVNNYKVAERYYFKVWTRDSKNQYPQSQYWLGMMQKSNGKYKEAGKSFDRYYRRFARDSANYFTLRSKIEMDACAWALKQIETPSKVMVVHLDTNINSIHADFGGALYDSLFLYSTVRGDSETTIYMKEVYSQIYQAKGADTVFRHSLSTDSLRLPENTESGNVVFNSDHSKVYFTLNPRKKNKDIRSGIYSATYKDGQFGTPEYLNSVINQENSLNTQPYIYKDSTGKEKLFFVSDRTGGSGKLDIWYCSISTDGKFGPAINAGRFVNSPDNEVTPFINDSTSRLYFGSTYPKGMGGFDIFYSEWSDSLMMYKSPQNPGYPFNTAANELYYLSKYNDRSGYFSSNRKGSYVVSGENCCNDIYFFQKTDTLAPVKDSVPVAEVIPPPPPPAPKEDLVEKIKLLVPLTLYFNNDEPDNKTNATTTLKTYDETFRSYMKAKDKYKAEYAKGLKGIEKEKAEKEIEDFFTLQLAGGFAGLENFAALLLENLEEGRLCTITLQGFCSPLASTDYNKNLAKRRISSLKNYFMNYGNGILVQYMSELPNPEIKGKIRITEEDVGELPVNSAASDNYQDQRNSVYSKKAALERKIEIIAFSAANK